MAKSGHQVNAAYPGFFRPVRDWLGEPTTTASSDRKHQPHCSERIVALRHTPRIIVYSMSYVGAPSTFEVARRISHFSNSTATKTNVDRPKQTARSNSGSGWV